MRVDGESVFEPVHVVWNKFLKCSKIINLFAQMYLCDVSVESNLFPGVS